MPGLIMTSGRTAFIYAAQGTQWAGMGRDLLERDAVFDDAIRRCDQSIRRHFDWSLREEMAADPSRWRLHADSRFVQPAVTSLQIALTQVLSSRGIRPDGVGSLSMGEAAAMYAAGAISLDGAINIACSVARFGETPSRPGLMATIGASAADCREWVQATGGAASLAVELGPGRTVISGERDAVRKVLAEARRSGCAGMTLPMAHAYHSPDVEGLAAGFLARLSDLEVGPTRMEAYSSVTARVVDRPPLQHWWEVCSQPAWFHTLVIHLLRQGYRSFVEIGPHPMLGPAIEEAAAHAGVAVEVWCTMRRDTGSDALLMQLPQIPNDRETEDAA